MPQAIVAKIPEPHASQVVALWAELRERFNIRSDLTSEFPHFSLHVARSYDQQTAQAKISAFAAEQPPLRARTAGLGLFTGSSPVLYLPLVRNPRLNAFHRNLWRAVSGLGDDVAAYYRPERWIPHVTLALENIDRYNLGGVIHWLADQKLDWAFDVSELALLQADGETRTEVFSAPLVGAVSQTD